MDLNHRPSGYEPDELPDCSTPRRFIQYSDKLWEWVRIFSDFGKVLLKASTLITSTPTLPVPLVRVRGMGRIRVIHG